MKLTHALSASVLAGALLFSATACSSPKNDADATPTPQSTSSATPTPSDSSTPSASSEASESVAPSEEAPVETASPEELEESSNSPAEEIAGTVSAYYNFVATEGSLDAVKAVNETVTPTTSNTELNEIAASFEGLQYFDTSSPENIKNALSQIFARATQSERKPGATAAVPLDAVVINGKTATVDASKISVTVNDAVGSATQSPFFENAEIKLVKKDDGSWVMLPEAPRQAIP